VSRKYNNPCPCSSEWSHPQQDCTMYCDKYYAYLLTKDFNELEDRLRRKLDDWKEEVHRHIDEVVARIRENEQLQMELGEAQEEIEGYKQYNQAIKCANEELRADNERLREALERIAFPMRWFQKEAEKNGAKFNGAVALAFSDDANYLKTIAQNALATPAPAERLTSIKECDCEDCKALNKLGGGGE
jgi:regulator of replication initiation timing